MQSQKLDSHIAGEPVLANGKYSAHLLDAGNVPFKKGKIMWSDGRFSHVPGRTSAAEYEEICRKLNDTSKWAQSRPESKFEPGFAEYTTRPIDWERQQVTPCFAYSSIRAAFITSTSWSLCSAHIPNVHKSTAQLPTLEACFTHYPGWPFPCDRGNLIARLFTHGTTYIKTYRGWADRICSQPNSTIA